MKIKYVFAMLVIFTILSIMGCSNDEDRKNTDSEFPPSMNGLIISDGKEYQMEKGNYRWERRNRLGTEVVQTDHASPYQTAEHLESISTNPNQKIAIKIEGSPKIKVYLWNEIGRETEIIQNGHQITLPSSEGKYIYEALAEWANGTISYTFVAEVK